MRTTVTAEELLGEAAWAQRLAHHLVRDEAAATDLMQDTWVAALRAPPGADGPLRPWLRQVIGNLIRNRARDEGRRQLRHLAAAAEPAGAVPTPELLMGRMELQRTLAAVVTALEEPYRQTLLLHFYEGLSSAEIARAAGVPAGTVRWRLKMALDDVRRRLDERHGGQRRDWLRAKHERDRVPGSGCLDGQGVQRRQADLRGSSPPAPAGRPTGEFAMT